MWHSNCSTTAGLALVLAVAAFTHGNAQPFQSVDEVRTFFACKTVMIYAPPAPNARGTQVWYVSANATVHLWAPALRGILRGEARAEADRKSGQIILFWRYGGGGRPMQWQSATADNMAKQVVERLDGDVFRLAE